MKKLLAVLSTAGLAIGIAGAFGATAATATPAVRHTVFAMTVSKTTGLSKTAMTTLTVKTTGATKGDLIEAGICNDDASQANPLSDPTDACTAPDVKLAPSSGKVSFTLKLKPGLQGGNSLSGCPQSTQQYGLGVQCIVAAADLGTKATADAPLYFKGSAGTASGTHYNGVLKAKTGFAVAGLYGSTPSNLASGCQSFSSNDPAGSPPASWTGIPLCDDGDLAPAGVGGPFPAGDGLAAGEGVEVEVNGSPVGSTQAVGDQGPDVTNPGGATFDYTFPNTGVKTSYTITFIGVGDGTADGSASGVVNTFTAKVSATGKIT